MATVNYKCPQCGAPLKFDPEKQLFSCEYCLGEFSEKTVQELYAEREAETSREELHDEELHRDRTEQKDDSEEQAVVYTCPSCGAEVITTESTAATMCFYCQNPVVLGGRLSGEFKPDRVIPFALSKEGAIEKFVEFCGKKWFLPKGFANKKQFEKLTGVYFPYWYVDEQKHADSVARGKKVRTWTTGDDTYTETKYYRLERGGDIIIKNVFERALKNEDRQMLQSVHPYDLTKAHPFAMSYLSGFQAEKRDIERAELKEVMEARMKGYAQELLKDTMDEYTDVEFEQYSDRNELEAWSYTLLPVWVATYKYQGKILPFAINGQTGKTYGELPLSYGKLAAVSAAVAVAVFALAVLGGMLFL